MISYDSNIFIYYLEGHSQFGPAAKKLIEASGIVQLSVVLKQEVLTGYSVRGDSAGFENALQALHSLQTTIFCEVTDRIIEKASWLTLEYGRKLRGYDAIHLATALENGMDVFYTNDRELLAVGKVGRLELRDSI